MRKPFFQLLLKHEFFGLRKCSTGCSCAACCMLANSGNPLSLWTLPHRELMRSYVMQKCSVSAPLSPLDAVCIKATVFEEKDELNSATL